MHGSHQIRSPRNQSITMQSNRTLDLELQFEEEYFSYQCLHTPFVSPVITCERMANRQVHVRSCVMKMPRSARALLEKPKLSRAKVQSHRSDFQLLRLIQHTLRICYCTRFPDRVLLTSTIAQAAHPNTTFLRCHIQDRRPTAIDAVFVPHSNLLVFPHLTTQQWLSTNPSCALLQTMSAV